MLPYDFLSEAFFVKHDINTTIYVYVGICGQKFQKPYK